MTKENLELESGYYWVMFNGSWVVAEYFKPGSMDKSNAPWRIEGDNYSNHDMKAISWDKITNPSETKWLRKTIDQLSETVVRLTKSKFDLEEIISKMKRKSEWIFIFQVTFGLIFGALIAIIFHP